MTNRPRAFFAVDRGTATTAASIVAQVGGRWRLIGSAAFPAGVEVDAILDLLVARLAAADRDLAIELGVHPATMTAADGGPATADGLPASDGRGVDWPRVEARTPAPANLAILAPSERRRTILERAAIGSGWCIESASLERGSALDLMALAMGRDVRAVLLGAGTQAAGDERRGLQILGPLVAAVAARRPDVTIVLVGAAAQNQAAVDAARAAPGAVMVMREGSGSAASADALRLMLSELRADPTDSRRGIVRATATLAKVLGRRVETVEIGMSGGVRAVAGQGRGRDAGTQVRAATIAGAGLVRAEPDDELLDGVISWSSVPIDRPRLRDRLRELWLAPWAETHGEGAMLRLTAARAALQRLVEATPEFDDVPSPDLLVVAGGVWAVAPAPAVALAVLDVVRRSGVSQLVLDHARLLGPLGAIVADAEREALLADLVADALAPLGTAVIPQSLRAGRFVGRAIVHRNGVPPTETELVAGRLATLDIPPGETGAAELDFRDAVVVGGRGRRFAVDVAGGMAGVIVDLRDVPLRLPDRLERRRELLAAWQQPFWKPLEP